MSAGNLTWVWMDQPTSLPQEMTVRIAEEGERGYRDYRRSYDGVWKMIAVVGDNGQAIKWYGNPDARIEASERVAAFLDSVVAR